MAKNKKRLAEAVNQIVDIMMRSLEKFSPEEQDRRMDRIKAIFANVGRSGRERAARRSRIRPSRPSRRLRAKR